MIGQALGSARLAWECLRADTPDVFIDTIGAPFALPVAKLFAGCRVAAYVHYPTITTVREEKSQTCDRLGADCSSGSGSGSLRVPNSLRAAPSPLSCRVCRR
jgi:hypothetical protein